MTLMQELLQYTMHQHLREIEPVQAEASEDLGEWAALDVSSEHVALSSSQNGSPAKSDHSVASNNHKVEG